MTFPVPPEDSLLPDPPTKVAPDKELTSPFAEKGSPKPAQRDGELPAQVGRYIIDEELGRGGMGVVYRGRDGSLNRSLAIKVLRPEHQGDAGLRQRFLEEAQIMGQLQHPGVAPIHEIGTLNDGRPFFSMKQIKGRTLAELLRLESGSRGQETAACGLAEENATPLAATPTAHHSRHLAIFEQVCQTIAYAHSRGIIHRDLKPDNIMVGAFGEVQVMDWGLAKRNADCRLQIADLQNPNKELFSENLQSQISNFQSTEVGTVLGTPAYMAPEQARGEIENLDERCDVFGLGAILCEILTDQPPFPGDTQHDSHRKAMKGDLEETLARLDECGADPELILLAKQCLAADREARPRNADEVARTMARYQEAVQQRLRQAEIDRTAAQVKAAEERKRRKVSLALAGVVVAAVLVAGGATVWYFRDQAVRETEEATRQAKLAERKDQLEKALTKEFAGIDKQRAALQKKLGNPLAASALLSDIEQWRTLVEQTRETWKRAEFLLREGKELLDDTWSAQWNKLDQHIKDDERDLAWGEKLDKIREQADTLVGGQWQPWKVRDEYLPIFRDMNLDVAKGNLDQLAQKINGSPLRFVLVAALDHWADNYPTAKEFPVRLMKLARLVDPDDWRDQVRDGANWDDVEKLQELARNVKPEKQTPQILILLGRRLLWKGSKEAGATLARKALLHYPSDFWLHLHLASLVKNSAEEGGCYRAAMAIRPKSSAAHNNLGHVLFQQKDHDGAIAHFSRAIQLDPNYARAYYNLGVVRYQQKDLEEAIEHFHKALELDPKMVDAHINLGAIQYEKKDLDGAVQHFRKAAELDPKNVNAHINLGLIHYTQKNLDEAIRHYQLALKFGPKSAEAHNNLGLIFQARKDAEAALLQFQKAVQLNPNFAQGYYNLGLAWLLNGQFAEAKSAALRALKLIPAQDPLRRLFEKNLTRYEQLLTLEKKLSAVLKREVQPASAAEQADLAEICYYTKQHVSAARLYLAALTKAPNLAGQHRVMAACAATLAATGKSKDADKLSEGEAVKLRLQALAWLQGSLAARKKLLAEEPKNAGNILNLLRQWQYDLDLISVRDEKELAKLPEAERQEWQTLWAELRVVLGKKK